MSDTAEKGSERAIQDRLARLHTHRDELAREAGSCAAESPLVPPSSRPSGSEGAGEGSEADAVAPPAA